MDTDLPSKTRAEGSLIEAARREAVGLAGTGSSGSAAAPEPAAGGLTPSAVDPGPSAGAPAPIAESETHAVASEPPSEPHPSRYPRIAEPSGPATDSIAGYSIVREIHRGGQGVIYQAIQSNTRRKVAIKVMREGPFASKQDKARFEREVQVLGALKHPNIVAIHESGTAAGSFYFVMDYISGQPLDVYMAAGQRSVRDTLSLFQKVCEAVNAAHLRGVIHRDLKPGNIRVDADGEPQILDFGLAKVAAGEVAGESQMMTITGQFVGSLPWASPEQAEGMPSKIDLRTDVYSLGVVLYQMLTGKFPYEVIGSFHDVLGRIMTAPPVRPHTLRREIDDEVETIVLKALAKERERRYQSAGELARDVGHYLAGEPIEAKRDSTWYVVRKNLRRYKLAVLFGASFVGLMSIMLVTALLLWHRAAYERDRARSAEQDANEQRMAAVAARRAEQQQRELAQRKAEEAQAEKTRADERAELARRTLYVNQISLAEKNYRVSPAQMKTVLEQCPPDLRGWEWDRLQWVSDRSLFTLRGHSKKVVRAAYSPDGRFILSASLDGTLKLWDAATGGEIRTLTGHTGPIMDTCFSPDGRRIVSASLDTTLRFWDPQTAVCLSTITAHEYGVTTVAFSPDGQQIVSGGDAELIETRTGRRVSTSRGRPGSVRLWDAVTGKRLLAIDAAQGPIFLVSFAPGGRELIVDAGRETEWELPQDSPVGIRLVPYLLGLSPDYRRLACLGLSASARFMALRHETTGREVLWAMGDTNLGTFDVMIRDTASDQELLVLGGHPDLVRAVAFSPDHQRILTGGQDKTVRLWNAQTGTELATFPGHSGTVVSLAFSPDGRRFVSASEDGTVKVWETGARGVLMLEGHTDLVRTLAFSPDGSKLLSGSWDTTVRLWDVETGEELGTFPGHTGLVATVAFDAEGRRIASAGEDKTVRVWSTSTGRTELVLRGHAEGVQSIAFSPDGQRIASGSKDGSLRLWDAITGKTLLSLEGAGGWDLQVGFSADGRHVFSGGDVFKVWDAISGEPVITPVADEEADILAVSSDGRQLLLRFWTDPSLVVWDVSSGKEQASFRGHGDVARAAAFSPDGARVASAGQDQTVKFWNSRTGEQLLTLDEHSDQANAVAFSPDGQRIAVGGRSIKVWETRPPPGGFAVREAVPAAKALLTELFRELSFRRAVIERLRADPSIEEPLRSTALRMARNQGERGVLDLVRQSPEGVARVVAEVRSLQDGQLSPGDFLLYAEYLILDGEPERAARLLRQQGGDPENRDLSLVLGRALLASGFKAEARANFEEVITGLASWSPTPPPKAYISHWTAAFFLDLVDAEQFAAQYREHPTLKGRFACWPWFYIGQRMEVEGRRDEAIAAYRRSVELGKLQNAYHVHNWSAYRLHVLTGRPLSTAIDAATSQPTTQASTLLSD